jgi:capsular exopolysaccharide synthesis family protein
MMDSTVFAQGGSTGNDVREVFRFINRHKILIVSPMVLFAGTAWIMASTMQPRFVAKAVLALDVRKVQVVEHEIVSRLPQENAALRTELDVIGSRSAAEELVDRSALNFDAEVLQVAGRSSSLWQKITCDAQRALLSWFPSTPEICPGSASTNIPALSRSQLADWIVSNLKVTNDGRSLTIDVTFTSESPAVAARIATGLAETYLDDQVRTKTVSTVKARDWLHEQLITMRRDLEASEAAVDNYRRQSGLNETKGETLPSRSLGEVNAQLVAAQTERARVEANLQAARESGQATTPDINASPMMQQLRRDLDQIESLIAENTARSTHRIDKVDALEAQAAAVRRQMNQEATLMRTSLSGEVQAARQREAQLTRTFHEMETQARDAAHASFQLHQLEREADANRTLYDTFFTRYKEAMEQEGLATPDARLISRAVVPDAPVSPNEQRFLLFGTVGGLAVGFALAFLRNGFDRRIRHASEVEMVTGIPVFGLLPKVSGWRGVQPQDYPTTNPHSRFCAALSRIHVALRAPKSADRAQVILVTSAQPGDGKTTFCVSLARSFAKSRLRVLVVDADPYRSQVRSSFGASKFPASAPIVSRSAQLGDIVQTDTKSAAHFIPAPTEEDFQLIIHSGGFEGLLDAARSAYDIVIIDTPPVMTSADAAIFRKFADTRLLVVRWGRTSWDKMTATIGFLRLCHVGLDGIVISAAETGSASYGRLTSYDTALPESRFLRPSSYRGLSDVG